MQAFPQGTIKISSDKKISQQRKQQIRFSKKTKRSRKANRCRNYHVFLMLFFCMFNGKNANPRDHT